MAPAAPEYWPLSHLPSTGPDCQTLQAQAARTDKALNAGGGRQPGLPDYMCDPETFPRQAWQRPVLAVPSGDTMEQAAAKKRGVPHVPNRLLQRAIEQRWAQAPDWDEVICPITLGPFEQPVQIASPLWDPAKQKAGREDHVYDLDFLYRWFSTDTILASPHNTRMPTSPMTRAQVRGCVVLVPNFAIMDMCRRHAGKPALSEADKSAFRGACRRASAQLSVPDPQFHLARDWALVLLLRSVGLACVVALIGSMHRGGYHAGTSFMLAGGIIGVGGLGAIALVAASYCQDQRRR